MHLPLYPQAFLQRYLQLPTDLQDPANGAVLQTMQLWTSSATTMYDKLNAIVQNFHTDGFVYSTNNPDVPAGLDAATYLLQLHQGYCTWYATAMVVMARLLGIPARIVEGFSAGTFDPQTQQYVVRGTNAHVWAQAYFPGYGWINFEPTVSFSNFARPITGSGTNETDVTPPARKTAHGAGGVQPKPPVTTPVVIPVRDKGGATPVVVTAVTISFSLLLAIALLLALGVALWWRRLFRSFSPVSRTFGRMAVLGRLAGVPSHVAQTATEYGEQLAAQSPDQRDEIESITEMYVQERWAPAPTGDTASLEARWQSVRDALLRRIRQTVPERLRHPRRR